MSGEDWMERAPGPARMTDEAVELIRAGQHVIGRGAEPGPTGESESHGSYQNRELAHGCLHHREAPLRNTQESREVVGGQVGEWVGTGLSLAVAKSARRSLGQARSGFDLSPSLKLGAKWKFCAILRSPLAALGRRPFGTLPSTFINFPPLHSSLHVTRRPSDLS